MKIFKLSVAILFCGWTTLAPGLAGTTDPLEKKLTGSFGREKIYILNELSNKYSKKSPEKSIAYGNLALDQALESNDRWETAKALQNIGRAYLYLGQEGKGHEHIYHAQKIFQESLEGKKPLKYFTLLGNHYRKLGNWVKALEFLLEALKISKEQAALDDIASISNKLGAVYWDLSEYDNALERYLFAMEIFKAKGDQRNWANTLNNIGMVYHDLGNTDKAFQFYRQSLEIRKKIDRKIEIAGSLNNIGAIYRDLKNFPAALEFFQTSLKIREQIDDRPGIVKCLTNMGLIYWQLNNNSKASENYRKALTLAEGIGDERIIALSLIGSSDFYIKTKAYNQAYPLLMRSLKITEKFNARSDQMEIYSLLSQLFAGKGNYKKALQYFVRYTRLNKTIFSDENREKINKLETKHEIAKKEKENEYLKKENQNRKLENRFQIIISITVILLLTAVLIIIYRYYQHYKNDAHLRAERQKRLELESTLKLFQARINPHFLFNSLDSIKELGYEHDPRKLEKLVHHLSDMYRRILNSNETLVAPLENEITIVKDYLEIKKRMMKGLLDYHIYLDDVLQSFQIMPLSIETLVENSVIHGISPRGKGTINISIYKKNASVLIEISDDGVGFDIKEFNLGFGLYSIQERLKMYYQDKAKFYINSYPGSGTRATMELPYA